MTVTGGGSERVLVVGSSPDLEQLVARPLRIRGLRVRMAASVSVAEIWHRTQAADLLIADARAGGSVDEVASLRGGGSALPTIFLAGSAQDVPKDKGKSCLYVPFESAELADTVARALAERPQRTASSLPSVPPRLIPPPPTVVASPPAHEPAEQPEDAAVEAESPTEESPEAGPTHAGVLSDYRLANVLHTVASQGLTGILHLQRDAREKRLFIQDGTPVFVQSSFQHETLGAYLLRTGAIDEEQHRTSIERMQLTGKRMGAVLVEMGAFGPADAMRYLDEHIQHKAIAAFGWTDGHYRFEALERLPGEFTEFRMNPCQLVMQGLLTHFDPEQPPRGVKVQPNSTAAANSTPGYSEHALGLSSMATRVHQALLSGKPISVITTATGLPFAQVAGIAYALHVLEMVVLDQGVETVAPHDSASAEMVASDADAVDLELDEADVQVLNADCDAFLNDYLRLRPLDAASLFELSDNASENEIFHAFGRMRAKFHPNNFDEELTAPVRDKILELWARIESAREELEAHATTEALTETSAAEAASGSSAAMVRNEALQAEQAFRQGRAALQAERFSEARSAFGRALEHTPNEPAYLAHAGWTEFCADKDMGRSMALSHIQQAIALDPSYAGGYYFLGRISMHDGTDHLAIGHFDAAVRADPDHEEAARYRHIVERRAAGQAKAELGPKPRGLLGRLLGRD